MAFPDNRICGGLADFSSVDDARPENENCDLFDDEEEDLATAPSQLNSGAVLVLSPCCVCLDQISQVTMYPCGHMKVCTDCWEQLVAQYDTKMTKFLERNLEEEYRPKLKCPFCNSVVENYLKKTFT